MPNTVAQNLSRNQRNFWIFIPSQEREESLWARLDVVDCWVRRPHLPWQQTGNDFSNVLASLEFQFCQMSEHVRDEICSVNLAGDLLHHLLVGIAVSFAIQHRFHC
eukprot:Lithocolla_globosa_v1_NODE_1828_length_2283_cov_49.946809.p3 type:complete len:106 gc:universal NODE_1828_length_2283_cov_49.946809:488-171(-)